jgi:DNA-binding transcriptional MerR regulator
MKLYTVKQLARMAGVSVRALHHYDDIGLLKPASVGENGYRYYGREELLRLQQILFHRELEFPLEAIAAVLAQPSFDRMAALRRHREKLSGEAARYRRLLRTLDDTLASLEGAAAMEDRDMFKGFAPEKQAEYEAWLVKRMGGDMQARIDKSKKAMGSWSKDELTAFQNEGRTITREAGAALAQGLAADSEQARGIMRRHLAWVTKGRGDGPPNREGFTALGRLYVEHPDFRANYDAVQPGLADYMAAAMKAYAERELQ